jgi:hypothetical protein
MIMRQNIFFNTITIATTCNIVYQTVLDISETMTNLDIVSLRSDVILSKPQELAVS